MRVGGKLNTEPQHQLRWHAIIQSHPAHPSIASGLEPYIQVGVINQ
jgi:hypothetical protein